MLYPVAGVDEGIVARFVAAGEGFAQRVRQVGPARWSAPTPCGDWDVRALVNHVTQGNLNYGRLLAGATAAEFLRMRDVDALGDDPLGAFLASAEHTARAFSTPGALERVVDHPSGRMPAGQALAVRTTDTVIHTWDLARAVAADDALDPVLLAWIEANIEQIYEGMAETPVSPQTTHRFFAAPAGELPNDATVQERLLHLFGRMLDWSA